jgi:hypothetical protein
MAQSINTYIIPSPGFTLAAGATANLDVRLSDIVDMSIMLQQTWAITSGTTGLAINLYPGFGSTDPLENPKTPIPNVLTNPASSATFRQTTVPIYGNNFAPVTDTGGGSAIIQPVASTGSAQTTNTVFYLATMLVIWPNWVSLQIVNLDQSHSCTVALLATL